MQLRIARLCLDCEEIHAEQQCPVCASEAFTFIKRWVPAPERRSKPRTDNSAGAEAYRRLPTEQKPVGTAQLVKRALLGLAAASVASWLWNRSREPHPPGHLPPALPQSDRQPSLDQEASG